MGEELHGLPAAPGVAVGQAVVLRAAVAEPTAVTMSVRDAVEQTATRFEADAEAMHAAGRQTEADLLEAYAMLARDPALAKGVAARIEAGVEPPEALAEAGEELAARLRNLADEYFAQRADDLAAVTARILDTLRGTADRFADLPEHAVVVALDLSPAETVRMDVSRLAGLATQRGGPTSHTAIVARSLGVPAAVGVAGLLDAISDGDEIVVDGDAGTVLVRPDAERVADARRRLEQTGRRATQYEALRGRPVTFAGRRVLVAANIGAPDDLEHATKAQADGVGLFRSEFLFLDRDAAPDADEQAAAYRAAAAAFSDPVVVRTLDIGGDKEVAYLDLPREENPFLGVRGLRLTLAHPELFATQLDALLAAASSGPLQIMLPMIATVADLDAGRAVLEERARAAGIEPPPLGVMIETPSAALVARHLAAKVDFFSVGTNDLTQYVTGADRGGSELGSYQDPLNPAVLQLIAATVDAAGPNDVPVAVCGEAAADAASAAVLLGLGVTELSVAPALVDRTRWLASELDSARCIPAARQALELPDAAAVRELFAPLLP